MFDTYKDVVTINDVCSMLAIGKSRAYRLLREGELRGFKIGRTWKITKDSVIEYISHNTGAYL